jgi:ATP-dependent Clp protease ATP-binding subunit ClpA
MAEVISRIQEQGVTLELSPKAKEFLIEKGFDPAFGARPLKRTIARYLEDPLAQEIIAGHFKSGSHILVDVENDRLAFHSTASASPNSTAQGTLPSSSGA